MTVLERARNVLAWSGVPAFGARTVRPGDVVTPELVWAFRAFRWRVSWSVWLELERVRDSWLAEGEKPDHRLTPLLFGYPIEADSRLPDGVILLEAEPRS